METIDKEITIRTLLRDIDFLFEKVKRDRELSSRAVVEIIHVETKLKALKEIIINPNIHIDFNKDEPRRFNKFTRPKRTS